MTTNISGIAAPSTSGPLGAILAEARNRPAPDYTGWTTEQLTAEMARLEAALAAGPRLFDESVTLAWINAGVTVPDGYDIALATIAVLRHAADDTRFRGAIVTDYTIAGRTADADSFLTAVAEVSAR